MWNRRKCSDLEREKPAKYSARKSSLRAREGRSREDFEEGWIEELNNGAEEGEDVREGGRENIGAVGFGIQVWVIGSRISLSWSKYHSS